MTGYAARLPKGTSLAGRVGVAAAVAAVAPALVLVLYRYPPTTLATAGFAAALLAALALALLVPELTVALGIFLLAAVRFEPAPSDLLFAVLIAIGLVTGRIDLRRVPAAGGLLVAAFLALNLVSAVDVVDPGRAAAFFSITLYVATFGLWLATFVDSRRATGLIVRAYVAAAVLSAVLSTLTLLHLAPGHHLLTRIGREEGLFKDPNVYGPFLVPAALIVIEELLSPRLLRLRRSAKLFAFFALTVGVVFSYSRAAWLNLAVGLIVMLVVLALRSHGGRYAARAFAAVLLVGVAVTAVVAFTGSGRFLEDRAGIQSYDSTRFGAQSESIGWAERYPFGIGPGQFERYAGISVHSTYARALAEEGVPGLLVIAALMFATWGWAAGNAVRGRDTYGIGSAALLGAWCGIIVNSVFVDTLHWRHLWLVAALVWAGAARRVPARA